MVEKSIFLKEQGNTPINRIWNFLIVHSEFDYSMKEIARYAGVGYTTLKRIWKDFKKRSIIIQTREIGKAKMYKLNLNNPVVKRFIDYYWSVIESVIEKDLPKGKKETSKEDYASSSIHPIAISAKSM